MRTNFFLASVVLVGIMTLGACSKQQKQEEQEDVSIIGTWVSYNHDVMDEFAYGVEYREAGGDFKVIFTEKEAEFFLPNGEDHFKSTYEETEPNSGKYVFMQAFNERDYKITAVHEKDYLLVMIGGTDMDWIDKFDCAKVK